MSMEQFQNSNNSLAGMIETLVEANVTKSDGPIEECQYSRIDNAVTTLWFAMHGIQENDLAAPEADHDVAFVTLKMTQVETLLKALNHVICSHHALDVLTKPVMLEVEAVESILADILADKRSR